MKHQGLTSRSFLAALFGFLLAGSANAQTYYYVATNGSGSGTSWANAYTNIQTALDVATSGDTVCIAGGQTFSLSQQLTMTNSGVSIIGGYERSGTPGIHDPSQWETIITRNAAFDDFRLIEARSNANILIEGVTLTGGRFMNHGSYPGLFLNGTTNVTVRNCVIRGNGISSWPYYTDYGAGVGVINATNVLFSGCTIADNVCVVYGGGAYLRDSYDVTFTNCVIKGNSAWNGDWCNAAGILAWNTPTRLLDCQIIANQTGGGGCGGVANYNCDIYLKNCLVAHNIGTQGAGLSSLAGHMIVENCTIPGNVGCGVMLHSQNGATLSITNSIIWDNTASGLATYNGSDVNYGIFHSVLQPGLGTNAATAITANPLFENSGAYGSYLSAGSPCIDAGYGNASDLGLSGMTVRIDGSYDTNTVDIGYHYAAGINLATKSLYVSIGSGNDSNAGTEGAPFKTITHALAVSTGGEIVHVAAGTYSSGAGESFPLTFTAKNGGIEIIGEDPSTTIIVGGGRAFQISLVNSFALRNVTIRDSYRGGAREGGGAAYLLAVGSTTISNCWISSCGCGHDGYHQQPGGAIYHKYCSLNLTDCIFSNNAAGWSGAGGAVYTASGTMNATRCVFKNNIAFGGYGGGAVYIEASLCAMSNVLFAANAATYHGDAIYVASGSLALQNATIVSNGVGQADALFNAGGTASVRNSIFWGNGDDVTGTVSLAYCDVEDGDSNGVNGCISADPRFVDQTYFHLESPYGHYVNGYFTNGTWSIGGISSPCIDSGDPSIRPANEPSRNGALINMGAYGNTAFASKSPPIEVATLAAADVHPTYATLRGELITAGDPYVTIRFYWGKTDGVTTPGIWTTNELIGQVLNAPGVFSLQVSNLEESATYYFNCFASNSVGGTAWASSANFIPQIAPPNVANMGVDNESGPTPTLKGEVTNIGGEAPNVYICWGAWEGSNSTSTWQHVDNIGIKSGAFSHQVTTSSGTGYYYTCYAVNSAGNGWASPSLPFGGTLIRYVNPGASGAGTGYNWSNGYATVQAALAACRNDRTNIIYLAGGTYTLSQSLLLTNSYVSLRGGYSGAGVGANAPGVQDPSRWETIITRNAAVTDMRLLKISSVADVLIDGITFTGGRLLNSENGAGIYLSATTNATVRNCRIRQNGVYMWGVGYTTYGAGIYAENPDHMTIADCTVSGNIGGAGGGIYLSGGTALLTNCVIRDNQGNIGWSGGGGGVSCVSAVAVDLYDCIVVGNSAENGGGVEVREGANVRLKNCLVTYNDALNGDGFRVSGAALTLENCTVFGNKGSGVLIPNNVDTLNVTNSILWGNGTDVLLGGGWQGHTYRFSYSLLGNGAETAVPTCFSTDPRFVYRAGFYLATNSPCVNAGSGTAAAAGLAGYTTCTDGTPDTAAMDIGYHYPTGFQARDLYVSLAGNDTWAGTEVAPFKTITHAFSVSTGGETIHLAAGSYSQATGEQFPFSWVNRVAGLSIIATNRALTRISAANASTRLFEFTYAPFVHIESITLADANFRLHATGGVGVLATGVENLEITNCVFSNFRVGWDGWHSQYGAALYQTYGKCLLNDCIFSNNVAETSGRGGALCSLSATLSANRCVFVGNSSVSGSGGAIYMSAGTMALTNVLVAGNNADSGGDGIYVDSGTLNIQNATIANNAGEGLNNAGGTATAHDAIFWGNGNDLVGTVSLSYCDVEDGDSVGVNGCISVDPLFYDTTYYHLQSIKGTYTNGFFSGGGYAKAAQYSPLVDAGDPASEYRSETPPHGKRVNMDAYGNTAVADLSGAAVGTVFVVR